MTAPYDPHTTAAFRLAMRARRRYCWCRAVREVQNAWQWGLEITEIWDDPRNGSGAPLTVCAYCRAENAEDSADWDVRRIWHGNAYPGDHRTVPSSHGYCEHGMDAAHHLCNGEPNMEALVAAGEHLRDLKENR